MMLKCPECHAELENGSCFCPECGKRILDMTKCPKCNAPHSQGSEFCEECGFSFTNYANTETDPENSLGHGNVIAGDVRLASSGKDAASPSMVSLGSKNVIAGDVTTNVTYVEAVKETDADRAVKSSAAELNRHQSHAWEAERAVKASQANKINAETEALRADEKRKDRKLRMAEEEHLSEMEVRRADSRRQDRALEIQAESSKTKNEMLRLEQQRKDRELEMRESTRRQQVKQEAEILRQIRQEDEMRAQRRESVRQEARRREEEEAEYQRERRRKARESQQQRDIELLEIRRRKRLEEEDRKVREQQAAEAARQKAIEERDAASRISPCKLGKYKTLAWLTGLVGGQYFYTRRWIVAFFTVGALLLIPQISKFIHGRSILQGNLFDLLMLIVWIGQWIFSVLKITTDGKGRTMEI